MATAKLMLRRATGKDKGTDRPRAIVIALSHKGKNTEMATGKKVHEDFWEKDRNVKDRVKKKCPQHPNNREVNNYLNGELSKAWECIDELKKSGRIESMTVSDISDYITRRDYSGGHGTGSFGIKEQGGENADFFGYANLYISRLENPNTRLRRDTEVKVIEDYVGEGGTLCFKEITPAWLFKFKAWRQESVAPATVITTLKFIRAVFNHTIDIEEAIPQSLYPFRKYRIPGMQPRNLRLPIETIRAIRDFETDSEAQALARDFFMLSFYLIGMNNSDIYGLGAILGDRVEYRRNKTSRPYSIKLEPEARGIFERRKGISKPLVYQERYSNLDIMQQCVNKALKRIGKKVGVPDLIMYHARHSWAGIAAKKPIGAGKPLIAQALGHGAVTVTDTYFDYDNELVDDLNRKVIDLLNEKKWEPPKEDA
jgi:integrase